MPRAQRAPSNQYRQNPVHISTGQRTTAENTRSTHIWTPEEDEVLVSARAQGLNWGPIASQNFPGMGISGNACRKRHERIMEKRNAEDWDGIKFEELANAYMALRKQMWTILGDHLGEKWDVLEGKCMERGLKNIQAAKKSHDRTERGMLIQRHLSLHQHYQPCEPEPQHDSGFGGSDTDAEYEIEIGTRRSMAPTITHPPTSYLGQVASAPPTLQHQYHPGPPMTTIPDETMMLRGRTMDPLQHGRDMSIHAMLSESPPGDQSVEIDASNFRGYYTRHHDHRLVSHQ